MRELDCGESWVLKNWCFWTVVWDKTLESPLDCKEIQPVHSKGYQSWVFFGRNDAKAETPVLWPPHSKSWLIGKDSDAGRDLRQEEKGTTEDEMAGWHHQLDAHEFGWTPGVGDGQGGLACCDSCGRKESDMTELLNWTELEVPINVRICLTTDLFELETVQPIILIAFFLSYITVLILSLMPTVVLRFSLSLGGIHRVKRMPLDHSQITSTTSRSFHVPDT